MRFIGFAKQFAALSLVFALVSCGAQSPETQPRGASCVLDAGDYSIRVVRGQSELEFIAPEGVRGTVVRFGADGECTIDTTRSLGRADTSADTGATTDTDAATDTSKAAGEYPGVSIPLADGRGFRDWLVLAYPEDHTAGAAVADDGSMSFELDGASYTVAPNGACTVTRGGLTRSATRRDE